MKKLPLYEAECTKPRAWLDNEGKITPGGPHPKIMFADVPVMLHLTNGHHIAPLREEWDTGPEGWIECLTCGAARYRVLNRRQPV